MSDAREGIQVDHPPNRRATELPGVQLRCDVGHNKGKEAAGQQAQRQGKLQNFGHALLGCLGMWDQGRGMHKRGSHQRTIGERDGKLHRNRVQVTWNVPSKRWRGTSGAQQEQRKEDEAQQ